jgi:hypothetical protein
MRLRGRQLLLLAGPFWASACALVADLGDRTLGEPDSGSPTKRDSSTDPPDDVDSGPVDSSTTPSFCTGITLYASFDMQLRGDIGGESTRTIGGVCLRGLGKFGGAISLLTNAAAPDEGAAFFFLASAAANPWPEAAGSISMWYRPEPGRVLAAPVLYRPVGSIPPATTITSGLAFYLNYDDNQALPQEKNKLGLYQRATPASALLVVDRPASDPYLRPNDYNHYFSAWQKAPAPTAFFALNGGTGAVVGGGTPGTFPDAAVNGELLTPYRSQTSRAWTAEGPAIGVRLGGLGGNSPEGSIDDLAIWNRVLSFEEAAAIHAANKPIGEVCKLTAAAR